jgi:uncharacterized protein YjiS (DUF1127 family)
MPFPRLARTFGTSVRRYRLYHRTVTELNSLTDRELADLGISRGDIQEIARATMI